MTTKLQVPETWVNEVAARTQPEAIHWCDGSEAEYEDLAAAHAGRRHAEPAR